MTELLGLSDKEFFNHRSAGATCKMLLILGQVIKGTFVWDQSGIRIIGIMRVSVCLGAILIPEYQEQNSRNIFRNIFLIRNIPNEGALSM